MVQLVKRRRREEQLAPAPYAVALAAVLAAGALRWYGWPLLGERAPLLTLLSAVLVAAAYGGLRPGLLATALTTIAAALSLEPRGAAPLRVGQELGVVAGFGGLGALVSALFARLHAADRQVEAALEAQRELVVDAVPAVMALLDADRRYVWMNSAWEAWSGLPREEVVGAHLEDVHGPEAYAQVRSHLDAALAGERQEREVELSLGGVPRALRVRYTPRRSGDGAVTGVVVLAVDETERRRALRTAREVEARFKQVFAANVLGFYVARPDGRIIEANDAFLSMLGYTRADVEAGQLAWDRLTPPEWVEQDRELVTAFLEHGRFGPVEKEYLHRDGSRVPVLLGAAAGSEHTLGITYVVNLTDVSERRRLEAEVQRRTEELALRDRRKDEFLAMLAHELRNPLAPVLMAVELMKVGGRGSDARARDIIERQVRHLARLVDDLLDVSRITRGKIALRPAVVPLGAALQRALETTRPLVEARGHHVSIEIAGGDIELWADPVRLDQILVNVLDNAAKYTAPRGRLEVRARAGEGVAVIAIRDNGAGIPPDVLPHVFDLFHQAGRSLDRSQGGLGIGLTIVKRLIELHGGRAVARSDGVGAGTEFELTLPLAEAGRPAGAITCDDDGTTPAAAPRRRVLVVDDNVDAAAMLAELLAQKGHVVDVAYDGRSALRAAQRSRPDLVFLDIGLPDRDGYSVATELRQDPTLGQATLIALTGYGQEADRARSASAGFDEHHVKPIDVSALERILCDAGQDAA